MDEPHGPYAPSVLRARSKPTALSDIAARLATPGGMAALFIAGFLIRIILARGGGFPFDMPSFQAWSSRLADHGPWHFYPGPHEKYFVDYPPGYLYVLWFLGLVAKVVGHGGPSVLAVKLPPVLGDLGLAWAVAHLAERLAPASVTKRMPVRGLAAAAILLNPAFFFISAVWGQVDVFLALPIIGAFILLGTGVPTFRREAGGMALIALAIGTKPQGAFVLPVVVLLLVWRHMREPSTRRDGFVRVLALGASGVLAGIVLLTPFRMWPLHALKFYAHSGNTYPVTSVFAFNFWGAIDYWRPDLHGANVLKILGVPALYWGLAFFAAGIAFVLRRAWRALRAGEDEGRVLVFGSFALSLVGFALLTRIHERYLFLPLALGAAFISVRWMRRAFVLLSLLYLINVYFPYVYYLRFVHRPAPTFGGFFDAFYGTDYNGPNMKVLAIFITVATLVVAWRGWRRLHPAPDEIAEPDEPPSDDLIAIVEPEPLEPVPKERWKLALHPIGRREVLIAVACFLVAFISRVAMLGHPPGMYFDEVYHARTGAEYLGGKEVFEWTHPPLGKEFIGFAIQHWSNFGARGTSRLPSDTRAIGTSDTGFLWATGGGTSFTIHRGVIDTSCGLHETNEPIRTDAQPFALDGANGSVYSATTSGTLVRFDAGVEKWSATLPGPAVDVGLAGDYAYVLTEDHQLVSVSPTGQPKVVAVDATAISQASSDKYVWAAFGSTKKVAAWDSNGARHAVIDLPGHPRNVSAIDLADRVYVSAGNRLISVESDDEKVDATMPGAADALGTPVETGIEWAASGRNLRAIEPHAAVAIGHVRLARAPGRLFGDPINHQIVGVAGNELECASGRPQFAWRIGSAIFGSAMVGMLVLLAFLLFGNLWVALLAALFLTIDGLAFSVSRIAMVDTYSIAFLLAAWFCSLSALRESGARVDPSDEPPRRARIILWLAAGGVFGGLGLASKWIGLYALVGIALLFFWDAFARGASSIWRVAGGAGASTVLIGFLYLVVPAAIYIASYIPYFRLGHNFGDFLSLQKQMYVYHATLKATHPFSSPWFGWPVGVRAVFLYLRDTGNGQRSEIWTFPNLVIFWAGLVAFFVAIRDSRRARSGALGVVILAALVQYLPWISVSRVTFMYHYLSDIPFLALLLAWWLVIGLRGKPYHREIAIVVTAAAIVFFFVTFPMLVGWSMPAGYLDGIRHLMPWVIR
jgi:predicted membrane-bound dolichyl-phosphate-mannose-protein mannosyltransferase